VTAPSATGRFQHLTLSVDRVRRKSSWTDEEGTVCIVALMYPVVGLGDDLRTIGAVSAAEDGATSYRAFLRSRGCGADQFATSITIEQTGSGWRRGVAEAARQLSGAIQRAVPGDAGNLLSGLVTGDDQALSPQRSQAFQRTSTTHLTAVSGSNLALLLAAALTLGTAAGWKHRLVWQTGTVGLLWGYALLAGLGPPTLRAALVATAAVFASRFGRRPDLVTLIVIAAVLAVAIEPAQMWRLSFQLSFSSSLALAFVLRGLEPRGPGGWLRSAVVVATAAHVATLPILLPISGRTGLIAVPANLLVAPLVDIAFPLAAVGGLLGLVWAPLGDVVLFPARLCADGVLAVVDGLAAHPAAVATGVVSRLVITVTTVIATAGVVGLSGDGVRWVRRLPEELGGASFRERAAVAGGAIGVLLTMVARVVR